MDMRCFFNSNAFMQTSARANIPLKLNSRDIFGQQETKTCFEKYYGKYPVSINKPGRYVHVKDDGIYTYMYEIDDDINEPTDGKRKRWKKMAGVFPGISITFSFSKNRVTVFQTITR